MRTLGKIAATLGVIGAIAASSTVPAAAWYAGPPSSAPGGPFVADVWLELLLFCGFALHVKVISAPGLTTPIAPAPSAPATPAFF